MSPPEDPRHVVVVGAGMAGLGCARRLADHDDVRVTLIDRHNYHQFQPLLYQVATSQLAPSDVAFEVRKLFREHPNVDVKLAEVAEVDPAASTTASPVKLSPSVVTTVRVDGSTDAAVAILTSTFSQPRNSLRSEYEMSLGASWDVATW